MTVPFGHCAGARVGELPDALVWFYRGLPLGGELEVALRGEYQRRFGVAAEAVERWGNCGPRLTGGN